MYFIIFHYSGSRNLLQNQRRCYKFDGGRIINLSGSYPEEDVTPSPRIIFFITGAAYLPVVAAPRVFIKENR